MVVRGQGFDYIWVERREECTFAEWAYHNNRYYHIHVGQRPAQVGSDNNCKRCRKNIPSLVALAFKLHGG